MRSRSILRSHRPFEFRSLAHSRLSFVISERGLGLNPSKRNDLISSELRGRQIHSGHTGSKERDTTLQSRGLSVGIELVYIAMNKYSGTSIIITPKSYLYGERNFYRARHTRVFPTHSIIRFSADSAESSVLRGEKKWKIVGRIRDFPRFQNNVPKASNILLSFFGRDSAGKYCRTHELT